MQKEFWLEAWKDKRIGFHKNEVHPKLIEFIDVLAPQKQDVILVPLCGKSMDMIWLHQQGYTVVGIELSCLAVEQFFQENHLPFEKSENGALVIYKHENITIYQGDFFALSKSHCDGINMVYDRAALIALSEDGMVQRYVEHLSEILGGSYQSLLITLDFYIKEGIAPGPPFPTSAHKLESLFDNDVSIELLDEQDIIKEEPKFKKKGSDYLYERVYLIQV